ncbi:unnamed protein product [Schistosoma curassoni]|uniref:Uncharacterized protein n=1 Tax=Schistosoma curassoni TaxID=6186 RepID=A0A183KSW0_9TREM|nr:unnamed protein product [Schistosoma curassoni]
MTSWVDAMFYSLAFIQPDDTLDNISRQGMRSRAHLPRYFVPYPRICSNFGRLTKYIGNHSQANSLVRAVYRKIISSSTQQRPNSLLRVYRGFAGSVQLRHYVSNRHDYSFHPINKICKPKHESWFSSIFGTNKYQILPNLCTSSADSINPKEFIAAGCNSAVWAAEVRQQYPNDNGN